jgi:hypothetical protein
MNLLGLLAIDALDCRLDHTSTLSSADPPFDVGDTFFDHRMATEGASSGETEVARRNSQDGNANAFLRSPMRFHDPG